MLLLSYPISHCQLILIFKIVYRLLLIGENSLNIKERVFCHIRYKFFFCNLLFIFWLCFWPFSAFFPEKPLWDLYPPPGCEDQSGLWWPGADWGPVGHPGGGWPFTPQDTLEPCPQPGPWNCDWQQSPEGYHWAWYLAGKDGQASEAGNAPGGASEHNSS